MSILNKLFKKNSYEKISHPTWIVNLLDLEIQGIETIFDIGAHKGSTTELFLSVFKNSHIYAFEPFLDSFNILNEKVKGNLFVTPVNIAISDFAGQSVLSVNNYDETNSLKESENVNESINLLTRTLNSQVVTVNTIDNFCAEQEINSIDLLKIDTQGSTFETLKGAELLLRKGAIKIVYAEVEYSPIYKGEKLFGDIFNLLIDHGFVLYGLYNMNKINKNQLAWSDVLFVKKELIQS